MHDGVIHTAHDDIPDFAARPTISSTRDGEWSDYTIWDHQRFPDATDIVHIAHNVLCDCSNIDAQADVVGVTGTLRFDDDAVLIASTILSHGGTLDLGSACEIIIRDKPLDLKADPYQFGTGIICIGGALRASGAEKTAFVRAGNGTIGWITGDRVVAPDVRQDNNGFEQCEVWAFGDDQEFDHTGGHIANLTRSVTIRSENPQGTRGHVMCVGDCQVDLPYVTLKDMGRTTAARLHNTTANSLGQVVSVGKNQQGRYSLHLHHLTRPDWRVEGCVADGSPRWGFAIHDTHYGTMKGNIAYDCVGGGFITEDGSETGNVFDGNLAILCRGSGDSPVSSKPARNELLDTGHEGAGFWHRAARNTWINNVAANCRWAGWNTFSRNGHVGKALPVMVPKFKGGPKVAFDARQSVPYAFDNNEAYACGRGFEWWYAWVAILTNTRVWNCAGKSLFLTYHGTALVDGLSAVGGLEGVVQQHDTAHLQLRNVDIDGAKTPLIVDPGKRGVLLENVRIDGALQPDMPHAPLSLVLDPPPESVLSGIVTLKVIGPTGGTVRMNVDGAKLVIDSKAPYEAKWDTRKVANGTHWVSVEWGEARDFGMGRYFVEN